jgi:hypothetical protein
MSIAIRRLAPLSAVLAVALALAARPAAAQRPVAVRTSAADSVATVVRRQLAEDASATLRTVTGAWRSS